MIVYHGTKNDKFKNNILENGIIKYKGNYGIGFYCASNYDLALEYACEDDEEETHKEFVLKIKIDDNSVKEFEYHKLANKVLNKKYKKNRLFEVAEPIFNLDEYAKQNDIKAIKINYLNNNEIIIYDLNCIISII